MKPADYMQAALRTEFTPSIGVRGADNMAYQRVNAQLLHAALGLCTETGELQDALKKDLIYGKAIDQVNIVEELGDIAWYLNLGIVAVGSSWEEVFEKNIVKLKKRFPDKFTQEAALNRDLDAERAALEARPQVPAEPVTCQIILNGRWREVERYVAYDYAQLCQLANKGLGSTVTYRNRVTGDAGTLTANDGTLLVMQDGLVVNVIWTGAA